MRVSLNLYRVLVAVLALAQIFNCATTQAEPAADAQPKAHVRKVEKPVNFVPAVADPLMGDWSGEGACVGQVLAFGDGKYRATLLSAFDKENNLIAKLEGSSADGVVSLNGDGWTATIEKNEFKGKKGDKTFALHRVTRTPPSLGAKAPKGAIVLFDGSNLDAWAKKNGKSWLEEDGPARWKLVKDSAVEVVTGSDCIITHKKFGDCKVHVEFRTIGMPSNSGVFLQDRYEVNINETYARPEMSANGGLDNCTTDAKPRIRPCRAPLEWQTYDIDFHAPRFDGAGNKTASARMTVVFNGVKIYDNQELEQATGAASRLGEAATGPLMLQEHGMPLQFRNVWLVETGGNS